ncbi:MAG: TPM domain-containing protein, partial [Acutalibacteraceae bacterium]
NGLVLTDNIGDQLYSFYACGEAENIFTDEVQDIVWAAYDEPETYYDAVIAYYEAVSSILKDSFSPISAPVEAVTESQGQTNPAIPSSRLLPLVVDNANLLDSAQEAELTETLEAIGDEYQMDIAVVTVTSLEGKTAEEYADDFYDYNGYGRGDTADGLLILYKPGEVGNRELQISTCGKAIECFPDWCINSILDAVKEEIVEEDYVGAFTAFAEKCEYQLRSELGDPYVDPIWIPLCLVFGFLIALIIMKAMIRPLKSVNKKFDAGDYAGNIVVTGRSEKFLYRNVNKTPIPKDTGSSGGSSTHTSSSGTTHGGGGTRF